jgi:hypothetical protein
MGLGFYEHIKPLILNEFETSCWGKGEKRLVTAFKSDKNLDKTNLKKK